MRSDRDRLETVAMFAEEKLARFMKEFEQQVYFLGVILRSGINLLIVEANGKLFYLTIFYESLCWVNFSSDA